MANSRSPDLVGSRRCANGGYPHTQLDSRRRANGGCLILSVLNAVAEFERDLLIERTQAGLRRARSEGKKLGRASALTDAQRAEIASERTIGVSLGSLAKRYGVSRSAIQRATAKSA